MKASRHLQFAALIVITLSPLNLQAHIPGESPDNKTGNIITTTGQVDATDLGEPIALDQGWRIQTGDNPQYANPTYDDSAWRPFDFLASAKDKTFPDTQGYVWLRIHLKLQQDHDPLSLLLDRFGNSYEVFANGQPVGNYGNSKSIFGFLLRSSDVYSIQSAVPGNQAVLAVRLWAPQRHSILPPEPQSVWIGPTSIISSLEIARRSPRIVYQFDDVVVALLGLLMGSGLYGLFLADRSHREYAWAGISLVLIGLYYAVGVIGSIGSLPQRLVETTFISLGYASIIASVEFLFRFLNRSPGIFVRLYQAALLVCACFGLLAFFTPINAFTLDTMAGVAVFSWAVLSAVLLIVWYLRGNREAAILLLPVIFFGLALPLGFFSETAYALGWTQDPDALIPDLHLGPVHFVFSSLAIFCYMLSFVVILGSRFLRTSHQQEQAAAEFAAAHRVQSRLVPVNFPALGRFSMEAAYIAAAEVGGDFYQAFPEEDGGLLFFMGDVSGKGLSAAMIGMLIVGALRTIAAQKLSPSASLALLNQQLLEQTEGGFVTCLCARISAAGRMVIANAGHLSPYLNGAEIDLANGLPLGITSEAEYAEMTVDLPPSARLTFVSDGVVEARNAQQELLGFARTEQLSTLPATEIAQAAQTQGQMDDITVVTIQCGTA
jgi:phosphoserine phosphatase RsbU/P